MSWTECIVAASKVSLHPFKKGVPRNFYEFGFGNSQKFSTISKNENVQVMIISDAASRGFLRIPRNIRVLSLK